MWPCAVSYRHIHAALLAVAIVVLSLSSCKAWLLQSNKFLTYGSTSRLSAIERNRWSAPSSSSGNIKKIESSDDREGLTYSVELPKSAGITWGSDLSFRWVYVLDLDPQGEASKCGFINKGDYIIGANNATLIAQDFDTVLKVS